MSGLPAERGYVRGIRDALLALGEVCNRPLDEMGNHPLGDLTTWEIHEAFRGAILATCRARLGRVPPAVKRAGRLSRP